MVAVGRCAAHRTRSRHRKPRWTLKGKRAHTGPDCRGGAARRRMGSTAPQSTTLAHNLSGRTLKRAKASQRKTVESTRVRTGIEATTLRPSRRRERGVKPRRSAMFGQEEERVAGAIKRRPDATDAEIAEANPVAPPRRQHPSRSCTDPQHQGKPDHHTRKAHQIGSDRQPARSLWLRRPFADADQPIGRR